MGVASHIVAFIVALWAVFFPTAAAAPTVSSPAPVPTPVHLARDEIIFGGDMMFDRSIRVAIDQRGGDFIFSCIDATLASVDIVVANLEGPITSTSSVSATSKPGDEFNYTFTFPMSTARLLLHHRIGVVNLGNNHIENFGMSGVRSTIAALSDAGVSYFGDPLHATVAEGKVGGVQLAFVNYNEFGGDASTTLSQIRNERALGFLPIVYTHWGIEYATTSSAYSRELAHSFVDAGAEMVVGSHPHVVQEHEIYAGKYIHYSLGNFIFDQYWNDDVRHGLLLDVVFGKTGVESVKEIPIELGRDRRTCPVEVGASL